MGLTSLAEKYDNNNIVIIIVWSLKCGSARYATKLGSAATGSADNNRGKLC